MKKWFLVGLLGLSLVTLLAACAPKESSIKSSSSSASNSTTTHLTLGTMPAPDSLPLYVAQEKGYFKDAGLDVDLKNFKSPKDRDTAIAGGQLDGAVTDIIAFTTYVNGQLGWKIGSGLTGYFGILTGDDSVKSVADLAGKKVALLPRQTPQFYLNTELAKANLTEKSVSISEVPQIPVRLQLVENKQVSATVVPDPFLSMGKAAGLRVLAQSNPKNYQTTIMAFDRKISKNADVRKRFYTAYNRAVKTINAHKASNYQSILTKQLGYPTAIAKSAKLPTYTKAKRVPNQMLGEAFNYAYQHQILKQEMDSESYQLKIQAD
ncbi:ABC transporter substrate-binding protein [Lacticaseibacillus saniviri]|nr:ABC transporter substrate-binding protein [Lacticaseibacillus saniviri]MCG4281841.1 MetQ/NlpA family ABC transporter substrate-binding protein [Lacticaseibacillus saniviri]